MTCVEAWSALRSAIVHLSRLPGLSWTRRLQLFLLKAVAITGYHWGKFTTLNTPLASREPPRPAVTQLGGSLRICVANGHGVLAVVVPVFAKTPEHIALLARTLVHLAAQQRAPDLVVLVDDGGLLPLPTASDELKQLVTLRLGANCGPACARNAGVAWARRHGASVVCFLDADCAPAPDWTATMERAQRTRPGIVCGRTLASSPGTAIGMYHDVCGTLNGRCLDDGTLLYGCTCNLSITAAVLGSLEFDTRFPDAAFEDVEFCVRARKAGVSLSYCDSAEVTHHFDPGIGGLFRQFRRYGSFERQMCLKHPEYLNWLWTSSEISCWPSVLGSGYASVKTLDAAMAQKEKEKKADARGGKLKL